MFIKKVLMIALLAGFTNLSSAHAGFTIDVNGETPEGIAPKLTVNRLTSADAIQASEGVPDLLTPLGLTGNINFGYKNDVFNVVINVHAMHSMQDIFNNILVAGGSALLPLLANNLNDHPIIYSVPMGKFDLILAKSEINNTSEWVLSMQSQRTGLNLFMDASQLTSYTTVLFNNNNTYPNLVTAQLNKTITPGIFPTVSNKIVTSQFTIESLSLPLESSVDSYTVGNGAVTFLFKSVVGNNN